MWRDAMFKFGLVRQVYYNRSRLLAYAPWRKPFAGSAFREARVHTLDGSERKLSSFVPRDAARPLVINCGSWS